MYISRGNYYSHEHDGCVVSVLTEYDPCRSGINASALHEGLARVQQLHTLNVLSCMLGGKDNHYLVLYLYIPNYTLKGAEVTNRIDAYMESFKNEHKRFWHRPRYNGEELRNVSTFMHDLNWYISLQTYNMSKGKVLRPRTNRRFLCLELNPERLPLCLGETALAEIESELPKYLPGVHVGRSQYVVSDSFTLSDEEYLKRNSRTIKGKKRRYDNAYVNLTDVQHMLDEWQSEYEAKVREATENGVTDFLDIFASSDFYRTGMSYLADDAAALTFLPIRLISALASKAIKYYLYRKMLVQWRQEEEKKSAEEEVAGKKTIANGS